MNARQGGTTVTKLGSNQQDVLRALARHNNGQWWPGAAWVWKNVSTTVRILESLVRRGLVTRVSGDPVSGMDLHYRITDKGEENHAQRSV